MATFGFHSKIQKMNDQYLWNEFINVAKVVFPPVPINIIEYISK